MEGEADFRVTLSAGIAAVSSDQSIHEAASEAERYLVRATAVGNGQIVSKQTRLIRRPQNVLLLTANQLIRMVLGGVLERDGFRVTFATDARQAAGLFEGRKRFHLIVIDEDIPPGGLHALRSLKKMERSLRVPAVMVLAKESGERREEYHGAGAVACFARPLDVSACVEKIREFVSTASPFRDPLSRMCRVLVVDEEPMQLYLAASSLDAYGGFLVSLAKGEEDAVRRLHDDLPEALIVPEAMLKRHSPDEFSLHGTPVLATDMDVILTTDSDVPRSGNAEEGIKGMLGKPFDCLSLGRTIEEMLGLSSSRSRDKASPDHVNREMQRIAGLAGSRARS
jgi:CheY-like chemotaxis protein